MIFTYFIWFDIFPFQAFNLYKFIYTVLIKLNFKFTHIDNKNENSISSECIQNMYPICTSSYEAFSFV